MGSNQNLSCPFYANFTNTQFEKVLIPHLTHTYMKLALIENMISG